MIGWVMAVMILLIRVLFNDTASVEEAVCASNVW